MSTDFEKFVNKNREEFDDASPSERVWDNIKRTIPSKKQERVFTIRDIYKWSAAAAIFFIALTSAYFLFIRKYSHEIPTVKTETPETPSRLDNFNSVAIEYVSEFKKASEAVEDKQKELKSAVANNPELYRKFQDDLTTLDSTYRLLREKASQSANQDVIIKAMIQNLQLQAEVLGRQLMIMHEIKTTKTVKDERNI